MKPQATEYILKVCEEDRLVVGVQNRPSYLKRILFFFQMVTVDFQGQIFFSKMFSLGQTQDCHFICIF